MSEITDPSFVEHAQLLLMAQQAERCRADMVFLVYSLTKWLYQKEVVLLQVLQAAPQIVGFTGSSILDEHYKGFNRKPMMVSDFLYN